MQFQITKKNWAFKKWKTKNRHYWSISRPNACVTSSGKRIEQERGSAFYNEDSYDGSTYKSAYHFGFSFIGDLLELFKAGQKQKKYQAKRPEAMDQMNQEQNRIDFEANIKKKTGGSDNKEGNTTGNDTQPQPDKNRNPQNKTNANGYIVNGDGEPYCQIASKKGKHRSGATGVEQSWHEKGDTLFLIEGKDKNMFWSTSKSK